MRKVQRQVGVNCRKTIPKLKTFISFFYAGHGAMYRNQQIMVLNGEEQVDRRTKELEWVFHFEIESWLKSNLTCYQEYVFVWATFDCCRSTFKSVGQLRTVEIEELVEDHEEAEKAIEKTSEGDSTISRGTIDRGVGKNGAQLNHLFIFGCPSGSTVPDQNLLVETIDQLFRRE